MYRSMMMFMLLLVVSRVHCSPLQVLYNHKPAATGKTMYQPRREAVSAATKAAPKASPKTKAKEGKDELVKSEDKPQAPKDMVLFKEYGSRASKAEIQARYTSGQAIATVGGVVGKPNYFFDQPKPQPSLYSQGIMGKPTRAPFYPMELEREKEQWRAVFGGPYKVPVNQPSLYSQGIMGKPSFDPPKAASGGSATLGQKADTLKAQKDAVQAAWVYPTQVRKWVGKKTSAKGDSEAPKSETNEPKEGVEALDERLPPVQPALPPIMMLMAFFAGGGIALTKLHRFRRPRTPNGVEEPILALM
eukprot:gnl/TRDRNA2_/TRDRNA2_169211_c0_seq1.p1 gnl/TRDRNA2_/TRDRNA2_169211_c0~~gnl/TRDRNA2_/TRDRNA2_169211_c0_seq1.p1  ORF type:complete len:303 (+),score=49.97 gnl/TRDRNA2_/TRDRNA2_169211_c0_seq1:60-968(+)